MYLVCPVFMCLCITYTLYKGGRERKKEEGEAGVGKSIRLAQCLKHLGIQVIVNSIHHYQ